MRPNASLFLSGFHKEDYEIMLEAAQKHGFQFVSLKEKNPWIALHFVFIV
jgi:ribosomal protein L11 methylase PrmA